MYGVSPFGNETAYTHGLKPVMTLETTVLTVRDVKRGETVGYAGAWRAERDSWIARHPGAVQRMQKAQANFQDGVSFEAVTDAELKAGGW